MRFHRFLSSGVLVSTLVSAQVSCPGDSKLVSSSFGIAGKNATYDYVVVGGGTAGNTLASILAEVPGISVAVIEAGGFYEVDNGNLSVVPGNAFASLDGSPLVDWGYVTTPQVGSLDREVVYPRGKTLGGSSARNIMVYHRSVRNFRHMELN
jgi:choline dehydrogenase